MIKDNIFDNNMDKFEDQYGTYSRNSQDTACDYQKEDSFNSNNYTSAHCYYDCRKMFLKETKMLLKTVGMGGVILSGIAYISGNKELAKKIAVTSIGSLYGYKKLRDYTANNSDNDESPFVIH